jgi:hypothetical protein
VTDTTDIAARLAAAGLRVKPLVWNLIGPAEDPSIWTEAEFFGSNYSVVSLESVDLNADSYIAAYRRVIHRGTRAECIAACERHHAESVLAMLETVTSEE